MFNCLQTRNSSDNDSFSPPLLFIDIPGAAAAAKVYLESLSGVAKQAQQGTCGGTSDIGKNTYNTLSRLIYSLVFYSPPPPPIILHSVLTYLPYWWRDSCLARRTVAEKNCFHFY